MQEHPIHNMLETAMDHLKDMVDVNTIIGEPIYSENQSTMVIPISKVGFGFAAGGSDFNGSASNSNSNSNSNSDSGSSAHPFGGGTGAGVSITPIAFLVVAKEQVNLIHLHEGTHMLEKLIDLAPKLTDELKAMIKKYEDSRTNNHPPTPE
ncbi:GerW family sporulation protein [Halalkalibacillus halophilus]|uniref:GerW family sporulation protein n=1 Tax=Halalkalibacillus halophilus TaxID=392827 RepID=UPI0003F6E62D|nr:GerW family sporulation protein [Halalkalibacillus halophilus]